MKLIKLEVSANNSTVGVAITQSGSGDILRLYDGTTQRVTIDDEGNVGVGAGDVSSRTTSYQNWNYRCNHYTFKAFTSNTGFWELHILEQQLIHQLVQEL